MAGSPINFTNVFIDSGTASGSQVEVNFQDVNDFFSGTKLSTTYLQSPRSNVLCEFSVDSIGASTTRRYYRKIPTGVTFRAISGQVAVDDLGGAASMTFDVLVAGVGIFTTAPSVTAADTVDERTAFTSTPFEIVAGTTVEFRLTSGAGGTVLNTSAILWGSTLHRA